MIALLVTLNLLTAPASPVAACAAVPDTLRVRLTIASPEWQPVAPTTRELVEQVWGPAGLKISWVDTGAAWDGIDVWIAALHGMSGSPHGVALGRVQFDGEIPQPLARLSIDAAVGLARLHRAALLRTPVKSIASGRADDPALFARLLGYAAAHEIGHFVLATKSHAATGVMVATYRHPERMADPLHWQLDAANLARFRQRQLTGCSGEPLRAAAGTWSAKR